MNSKSAALSKFVLQYIQARNAYRKARHLTIAGLWHRTSEDPDRIGIDMIDDTAFTRDQIDALSTLVAQHELTRIDIKEFVAGLRVHGLFGRHRSQFGRILIAIMGVAGSALFLGQPEDALALLLLTLGIAILALLVLSERKGLSTRDSICRELGLIAQQAAATLPPERAKPKPRSRATPKNAPQSV